MNNKPLLLVVDDTPVNLDVLTGVLEHDYQVRVAINGRLALNIAQMHPQPDLILLDIMMPEMDGYEVCQILKSQPNTSHIPIIFVTAKITPEDEVKGLEVGGADYITKPVTPAIALQRIKTQLALHNQQQVLYQKVKEQTEEINKSKLETIKSLSRAAEFKDNETGMHVVRMSQYCYVLAKAAGMTDEDAELLRDSASMHDVGKIGIPDHVLLKPGKLDPDEWAIMQTHVNIGVDILGQHESEHHNSKLLEIAIQVAQFHHEKWNGAGYPNGISGDEIPLVGRIAALADVFDALTSERPYKEAWSVEKAVDFIVAEKGSHFDPHLVDLFVNILELILQIKETFKDE